MGHQVLLQGPQMAPGPHFGQLNILQLFKSHPINSSAAFVEMF